jgi:hypothetical protein
MYIVIKMLWREPSPSFDFDCQRIRTSTSISSMYSITITHYHLPHLSPYPCHKYNLFPCWSIPCIILLLFWLIHSKLQYNTIHDMTQTYFIHRPCHHDHDHDTRKKMKKTTEWAKSKCRLENNGQIRPSPAQAPQKFPIITHPTNISPHTHTHTHIVWI